MGVMILFVQSTKFDNFFFLTYREVYGSVCIEVRF